MMRLAPQALSRAAVVARCAARRATALSGVACSSPLSATTAAAPVRAVCSSRVTLQSTSSGDSAPVADAQIDLSQLHIRPALTSFSAEEDMLRSTVAAFAREVIGPRVRHMDEVGQLDPLLLQQLFAQGLMGIETPAEFEGGGMSFVQSCIVIEELAKVDPAISVIVDIQNTLINTSIMKYGNAAQKKEWLPRLATDTLGSFALSEAGSGSDAFALTTRAEKQSDGSFVITGNKMWISNSVEAGLFIVFANAAPEKGYKGITAFLVPADAKGLSIGKKENKLGIRASSTCEVILDNVRVPPSAVLGQEGKGYQIAIQSLNEGRIGIGAQMIGLAQGAFDAAMPYVHSRKQFGSPIAHFQGFAFNIARAATEIEAARLLVYNAARLQAQGLPFTTQAAQAKLYASIVAESVASQAVEWHGGLGFTKDCPAEKFFRDSKIGSIYEGSTNMQLQGIAKAISKQWQQ